MSAQDILQLVGLAANLIGTIMVSFAGGLYFRLVDTSLGALETTVHTFLSGQQIVPAFTGLDLHRARAMKRSKRAVVVGLLLIALGFALQLIAMLLPRISASTAHI